MTLLARLWKSHMAQAFPKGCGGREVAGIDLAELDGWVAGLITSSMVPVFRPDASWRERIEQSIADLETVLSELDGEARDYFARLEAMARMARERDDPRS
jgi:hypothetical protein